MLANWIESLQTYRNPKVLFVLLLGFASGLPILLGFSTMSYWLSVLGLSKSTIGLFALVGVPYSLKFLWSPIFDHIKVPVLSKIYGRRKAWLLIIQPLLAISIIWVGFSDPLNDLYGTAFAVVVMTVLSASQDIVIDAYRIDVLEEKELAAGAAGGILGYRGGMFVAGTFAVLLSDYMDFSIVYTLMAVIMIAFMVVTIFAPDTKHTEQNIAKYSANPIDYFNRVAIMPFREFLERWDKEHIEKSVMIALSILAFVILYKWGDAVMGLMAKPFYREMGFSGTEIGLVSGTFGLFATLFGAVLGGILCAYSGVLKGLLVAGILQALANLLFGLMAYVGHDVSVFMLAVVCDNITGGMGTAAFVAFLSSLCNREFSATHYALLSSFASVGRTFLSSASGYIAEEYSWIEFFILTTLFAIPGLLLLLVLKYFKIDDYFSGKL